MEGGIGNETPDTPDFQDAQENPSNIVSPKGSVEETADGNRGGIGEPGINWNFQEIDNQGLALSKIEKHEDRNTPRSSRDTGECRGRNLLFGATKTGELSKTERNPNRENRETKTEYSLRPKPPKTKFFGKSKPVMFSTPGKDKK